MPGTNTSSDGGDPLLSRRVHRPTPVTARIVTLHTARDQLDGCLQRSVNGRVVVAKWTAKSLLWLRIYLFHTFSVGQLTNNPFLQPRCQCLGVVSMSDHFIKYHNCLFQGNGFKSLFALFHKLRMLCYIKVVTSPLVRRRYDANETKCLFLKCFATETTPVCVVTALQLNARYLMSMNIGATTAFRGTEHVHI